MFVKPAPGLVVRDPTTRVPLPAEGREVPEISYWHRRVRDGDAIVVEPGAAEDGAAAKPAQPPVETAPPSAKAITPDPKP